MLLCAAVSVDVGYRLTEYHVPVLLTCAACAAVFSSSLDALTRLARARATSTHRCTTPGCDFTVSLLNHDAASNRRWQEIAANHPHRI